MMKILSHRRRRSTVILGLLLLSIYCVSVECFVCGDGRRDFKRATAVEFPRTVAKSFRYHRKTSLTSFILKGQAEDDDSEGSFESVPDPSLDCAGSEPVDFMVPPVNPSSVDSPKSPGVWPCFDKMDKDLIKIAVPVIGNFAINPLIGAVDLFWVNRMGNALAVAGQAAANQVFSSAFWFTSFLPSGKCSK